MEPNIYEGDCTTLVPHSAAAVLVREMFASIKLRNGSVNEKMSPVPESIGVWSDIWVKSHVCSESA